MKYISNLLISLFLVVIPLNLYAQGGFTISLKLVDEKSQEAVAFATVSITREGEEKPASYALSNSDGEVSLSKVRKGKYSIKAELLGYKPYIREINVEGNLALGEVKMKQDHRQLDAASVSAIGNPIIVKKDTIEYNASSFKTSENDMLEELLKKLPGVEVEADGTITANGEQIKKITIDGKTFFLDDPQLASKNIPAKMIEKVKVVEKKSDQALFTGIDDGEEEMVIDLKMRPGMMQGWFGNVMVGGGHDAPEKGTYPAMGTTFGEEGWRYQGAAMVGRFTDKSQLSMILNANNTNSRGFYDMASSIMGSMRGGGGGMGRGRGGWGRGNGITSSWMGGLNGAFSLLDGKMDLAGNYLYNSSDNIVEEKSKKTTFMEDGSRLVYNNEGINRTFTQGHRFGVRLEHKFTEKTSILFEPQFNFGSGLFDERSDFSTIKQPKEDLVSLTDTTNTGFNSNKGDSKNMNASGFLLFRQRLGKPGRTISTNFRYNFSNNDLIGFNQSLTWYEDLVGGGDPISEIVNQRYTIGSKSTSLTGRLVYTEPLTEKLFLEGNYSYSWNQSKSNKDAFNSAATGQTITKQTKDLDYKTEGESTDDTYSNSIENRYINHRAGLSLTYQTKKLQAQIGLNVNPTNTKNTTNGKLYENKVVNWAPQAMFRYQFDDNTNMRFFYWGRSAQPSTSQLMPVPDNSNPLNIRLGNPYLKPYFSHSLRGMFRHTNKKTFTSVNARFGGSFTENPITSAQWYDKGGTQYSIPVTGPTSGNVDARVMVNSPFGKSGFSIFSMTYTRYNNSTSYIGSSTANFGDYYNSATAVFDYERFNEDHPDLGNTDSFLENKTDNLSFTQRLRFTYRNDFVEVNLGGRTRINKSWYTIQNSNQKATFNNQADFSLNWTLPWNMGLKGELDYNWYNGYTTPQEDEFIFNAEITQLLFKKQFTLALKAYDILNQAKNLHVTDEVNYRQEVINNTLGRYIILSLTYRFGSTKGFENAMQRGGPHGHRRR